MGIFWGIGNAEEAVMSPGAAATTSFEQDPLFVLEINSVSSRMAANSCDYGVIFPGSKHMSSLPHSTTPTL